LENTRQNEFKAKVKQTFAGKNHLLVVMKRNLLIVFFTLLALFVSGGSALAQKQIEPKVQVDPILEADAKHNLDVASQYFKLKKAYIAALKRCEEIIAAHPAFTHMDEVLYYAGMSSYYLSQGKGKQKPPVKTDDDKKKYDPAKLREDALMYLAQLIVNYPQSPLLADAKKTVQEIEPAK
jgi:outer membrane protein assembly factor BamD (BamD/ComL family)